MIGDPSFLPAERALIEDSFDCMELIATRFLFEEQYGCALDTIYCRIVLENKLDADEITKIDTRTGEGGARTVPSDVAPGPGRVYRTKPKDLSREVWIRKRSWRTVGGTPTFTAGIEGMDQVGPCHGTTGECFLMAILLLHKCCHLLDCDPSSYWNIATGQLNDLQSTLKAAACDGVECWEMTLKTLETLEQHPDILGLGEPCKELWFGFLGRAIKDKIADEKQVCNC